MHEEFVMIDESLLMIDEEFAFIFLKTAFF
jgi:hypothetical protein